jgi:hypothetical protein
VAVVVVVVVVVVVCTIGPYISVLYLGTVKT